MDVAGDHALKKREQKFYRFQLQASDYELLDHLSTAQREVLLSNGSYQERATNLKIAVGTVRSRLHRARSALEALREGRGILDGRTTQLN